MFKDMAIMKAFRKLFKYITGENEAGETMTMWVRPNHEWLNDILEQMCYVCNTVFFVCTGAKIDMTAPVLIKVKEEIPWLEKSVYVLSFLLPSAYQKNAPQPNDSTVSVLRKTLKSGPLNIYKSRIQNVLFAWFVHELQVYFTDMPDMKVYVKSYGGWMVSPISKMYSNQLQEALDKAQATYDADYHYDAGYNR